MGRELVRQLTAEGCDVATCDVMIDNVAETAALCRHHGNPGRVLTHQTDVSDEAQVLAFRDAVAAWRPSVNLLFNNAGIGGGGTIVNGNRDEWEKVFAVCWYGVYYSTRAFLPLLLGAPVGHVVNTSSVNGFWASIGPNIPHSAYSSAKFAVKGFTEALITDFAINAPHLRASVVMPGHIGTSIALNSDKLLGYEEIDRVRARYAATGRDVSDTSEEDLRRHLQARHEAFRDSAPTTAASAATIILEGVKQGEWRILVGDDAALVDQMVRDDPHGAYDPGFSRRWQDEAARARAQST
jgi:NAD(P)-dependent dehydrogenase (short-subunit alcohol dehydrogenase family)